MRRKRHILLKHDWIAGMNHRLFHPGGWPSRAHCITAYLPIGANKQTAKNRKAIRIASCKPVQIFDLKQQQTVQVLIPKAFTHPMPELGKLFSTEMTRSRSTMDLWTGTGYRLNGRCPLSPRTRTERNRMRTDKNGKFPAAFRQTGGRGLQCAKILHALY